MHESPTAEDQPPLVASKRHFALFLAILSGTFIFGGSRLRQLAAITDPNLFHFRLACCYLMMLGFEWGLLLFVWYGLRKTPRPMTALIGGRWASVWDFAKDVLIGLTFWLIWLLIAGAVTKFLDLKHSTSKSALALLPSTNLELILWLGLSASAGFCEEIVFRGYLQRQLLAHSTSLPAAILGQGILFGLVHRYQGLTAVVAISIMGILFGMLAARRKSLRPGILAHAWHDGLVGVLLFMWIRSRQ